MILFMTRNKILSKEQSCFLGSQLPQDFIYNAENYNTISSTSVGSVTALEKFLLFHIRKN